mmetsp:Transcript_5145/g.14416  ORF Transcript_5145/g.14416 Transcript_5145/m.14416 type:complete len:216 (-) Transcript_5145:274-921(-)
MRDTSFERQEICLVVAASLREYTQALPFIEPLEHRREHRLVVDSWHDCVLSTSLTRLRGPREGDLRRAGDVFHSQSPSANFQGITGKNLSVERRTFTSQHVGPVGEHHTFALGHDILRPHNWDCAHGLGTLTNNHSVERFLRHQEGDGSVTICDQHHRVHKLIAVVACQDRRPLLGQILHADDLDGSEENVVHGASEERPQTMVNNMIRLVNHYP